MSCSRVHVFSFELFGRHVRQRAHDELRRRLAAGKCPARRLTAPDPAGARRRARPKSSSFAPLAVSMTLLGFRSRWTIPAACAAASASAISTAVRRACASGHRPLAQSRRQRFTFEILHDEEVEPVLVTHLVGSNKCVDATVARWRGPRARNAPGHADWLRRQARAPLSQRGDRVAYRGLCRPRPFSRRPQNFRRRRLRAISTGQHV